MKTIIALSLEQMRELQSLGLDCSDASMAWIDLGATYNYMLVIATQVNEIMQWYDDATYKSPAYTLEDILMKLPTSIGVEDNWALMVMNGSVEYKCLNTTDTLKCCWGNTLIQNAFEMFKWVLVNHPDKIKWL